MTSALAEARPVPLVPSRRPAGPVVDAQARPHHALGPRPRLRPRPGGARGAGRGRGRRAPQRQAARARRRHRSLGGPPITRVYANIDEILGGLTAYLGKGAVTSASAERAHEGTTFEASCYADPLGVEHLTGSLARAVSFFGAWDADVQLRFTTKFGAVEPLIGLDHRRRTRVRMSVNAQSLMRFEGGTSALPARLEALGRLARDGYRVGLTVAPIQPVEDWRAGYAELFAMTADALAGVPDLDLTAELITHRFTPKSKAMLQSWYPGSKLEMDEAQRSRKLTKFGSVKHVYPAALMKEMRADLTHLLAEALPSARILYWT